MLITKVLTVAALAAHGVVANNEWRDCNSCLVSCIVNGDTRNTAQCGDRDDDWCVFRSQAFHDAVSECSRKKCGGPCADIKEIYRQIEEENRVTPARQLMEIEHVMPPKMKAAKEKMREESKVSSLEAEKIALDKELEALKKEKLEAIEAQKASPPEIERPVIEKIEEPEEVEKPKKPSPKKPSPKKPSPKKPSKEKKPSKGKKPSKDKDSVSRHGKGKANPFDCGCGHPDCDCLSDSPTGACGCDVTVNCGNPPQRRSRIMGRKA